MSLQDDLNAVRRNLDELSRKVEQLEQKAARQRGEEQGASAPPASSRMVPVPDTPYDSSLWTDTDDEGLGAQDRRAP